MDSNNESVYMTLIKNNMKNIDGLLVLYRDVYRKLCNRNNPREYMLLLKTDEMIKNWYLKFKTILYSLYNRKLVIKDYLRYLKVNLDLTNTTVRGMNYVNEFKDIVSEIRSLADFNNTTEKIPEGLDSRNMTGEHPLAGLDAYMRGLNVKPYKHEIKEDTTDLTPDDVVLLNLQALQTRVLQFYQYILNTTTNDSMDFFDVKNFEITMNYVLEDFLNQLYTLGRVMYNSDFRTKRDLRNNDITYNYEQAVSTYTEMAGDIRQFSVYHSDIMSEIFANINYIYDLLKRKIQK